MSDPAAPWWADVQHLRPHQDGAGDAPSQQQKRRFARGAHQLDDAAIATLEHEVFEMPADPWAEPKSPEERAARWAEAKEQPWLKSATARAQAEDAAFLAKLSGEAPAVAPAPAPEERPQARARVESAPAEETREVADLWDGSMDKTFSTVPQWAEGQYDARLLPKGAGRIENGRRTIEIRGQVDRVHGFTAPADTGAATRSGRRPSRGAAERFERRPDRIAMWAFLLGILLIIIAAATDPGAAGAAGF